MVRSVIQGNYHAAQFVLEKRLSHGISLTSSYIFAKTLAGSVQSVQDFNKISADYGRSDTDVRHVFAAAAVWQLDYLHRGNMFLRQTVNGWQFSPILRIASGGPLNITTGFDANLDGNGTDRPLVVGNYHPIVRGPSSWFNQAAFQAIIPSSAAPNAASVTGNAQRNMLSGPGYIAFDAGIARRFRFSDFAELELRGEATNVLNHPNLNNPGTGLNNASTFGVITSAGPMRQLQLGARVTF